MTSKTRPDVYLLPLKDDGAPDIPGKHSYIYLPPPSGVQPYSIRFSIEGTSSICRKGTLWTNIPTQGEEFERSKFRHFKYAILSFQVLYDLTRFNHDCFLVCVQASTGQSKLTCLSPTLEHSPTTSHILRFQNSPLRRWHLHLPHRQRRITLTSRHG